MTEFINNHNNEQKQYNKKKTLLHNFYGAALDHLFNLATCIFCTARFDQKLCNCFVRKPPWIYAYPDYIYFCFCLFHCSSLYTQLILTPFCFWSWRGPEIRLDFLSILHSRSTTYTINKCLMHGFQIIENHFLLLFIDSTRKYNTQPLFTLQNRRIFLIIIKVHEFNAFLHYDAIIFLLQLIN